MRGCQNEKSVYCERFLGSVSISFSIESTYLYMALAFVHYTINVRGKYTKQI